VERKDSVVTRFVDLPGEVVVRLVVVDVFEEPGDTGLLDWGATVDDEPCPGESTLVVGVG